jgi:putative membrane-bound dehydrogenase-like protein
MCRHDLRRSSLNLLLIIVLISSGLQAAEPAPPKDTQAETIALTSPQQAAASFAAPEGFQVSLFASEPDVRQPIAITSDARGRLWVAENNTYAEQALNYDLSQRDRIIILEDSDHNGRADRRKVFWDDATRLTSVEVGFGGVWALCPPRLVFLPDRNGDDVPDGAPEVLLEGFDVDAIRHNIANGLKWGPDGWLYGRHGIQATSRVGLPGTPADQRIALNCCIWRYHPTRKEFEVVCQGGTNSWGSDWNEHGELFFINTVIGHLWHAVPGTHYERMYGEDFNPHLYALMSQTADHFHWDTNEKWDVIRKVFSPTTDQAGGGHAHSGLLIYQGENWPARYRDTVLTVNYHGRRLNNDRLERRGAGYVGRHAPDLLKTSDPWFRALDLITGPDGGVYLADWCDIGECHENDGVHRSSGRIFKVTHGTPPRPPIADVAALDDNALVRLQADRNEWLVRQSRRVLQERAAANRPMGPVHMGLRTLYDQQPDVRTKLRALWALYVTGGTSEPWLREQLEHEDEHARVWAIRLLVDHGAPSPEVVRALTARAPGERSGLVLLYLASALQKLALADRWPLAEALAAHGELAGDPAFPLLLWYGIEPAVPESSAQAVALAGTSRIPILTRFVARRLTEDLKQAPEPVDRLVALTARPGGDDRDQRRDLLTGMAEALRGWRKAPAPPTWPAAQAALRGSADEAIAPLLRELSVVFGDGRAVDEVVAIIAARNADLAARRDAIRIAVEARAPNLVPLLNGLLPDRDLGADAIRGLAALGDPGTPALLIKRARALRPDARAAAIVALSSRPAWARTLLAAVAEGTLGRAEVPPFQIRQMQAFPDDEIGRRVAELWPALRTIPEAKRARIAQLKARLDPGTLAAADLPGGRKLFAQSCATCHTLFGTGAKIGPDLTGSQRSDLGYLLENLIDPAATVAADYRMSTLALADGRLLSGIVGDHGGTGPTVTLQTATERMIVSRGDIEAIRSSELSLMPEGQLDVLSDTQVRDLIAYLMAPQQVPLPEERKHEAAAPPPNVLLFCIDDLNDWIGRLRGHPQAQTPHMDRLAERGTLFANAHCQAPLCNPSRTSFLTGLRPSTTGVYALDVWFRTAPAWREAVTLPQHFAAGGYRTLTTGKVFHDAYPPPARRTDGSEFTVWGLHRGKTPSRPPQKLNAMPGLPAMDWGVFPERDEDLDDWQVANWAIEQLEKAAKDANAETGNAQDKAPFFLSVGFRHPHVPCYATQRWFDLYPQESLILPPVLATDRDDTPHFSWYLHWRLPEPRLKTLQEAGQWEALVRAYLASTSFVDSQVGRVLDALEAGGLAGNTIVVLLSDHGWHVGEKGISGKNTLWDRSTRVPLIVAGPGVSTGRVCQRPAELLDVYPTLAALCDLPEPPQHEGHSLVPQLRDPTAPRPWPAMTTQGPDNHGIRTERFRYIRYADGSEELYDMVADPNEWTNLAADPAHAATKQDLAHWLPVRSAPPLPGGTVRLLENREGVLYWEGRPVDARDPIPGIDTPEPQ